MRVSGKPGGVGATQGVAQSAASGTHAVGAKAAAPIGGDALSVSSTATFITVAQAQIAKIPDVREAKVKALKAKLESDEYHPDGEAVAEGLVRDYTPPHKES